MRIFFFNATKFRRYIDLDHIQQIGDLLYEEKPDEQRKDKDGLDVAIAGYGHAIFWVQFAFQGEKEEFRVIYSSAFSKILTVDIVLELRKFKAEYERLVTFWRMGENRNQIEEWKPST